MACLKQSVHPGGSRKNGISQRETGGKRDIAGEARCSAHVCGASGEERSFVLPCSGDCGDH